MECIELIHSSDNDRENTFAFVCRKMRNEDRSLLSYMMRVDGISRIDINVTIMKKSRYDHLRIIHCKEDR